MLDDQGHIQSENGRHRFAKVSRLHDMFSRNGVKWCAAEASEFMSR